MRELQLHRMHAGVGLAIVPRDVAAFEAAAEATTQVRISPGEIIVRWVTYLSAMALVGGQQG